MATTYIIATRTSRLITTIENVESYTEEDIQYYDGEYYRDTVDASTLGRSIDAPVRFEDSVNLSDPGDSITITGIESEWKIEHHQVTTVGVPPTTIITDYVKYGGFLPLYDKYFEQDDAFTHEPPRALEKTRSRIVFWSGAGGTGTMLGMVWKDDVLTITSSPGTIKRLV